MKTTIELTVNDETLQVEVEPQTTLLELLREGLHLVWVVRIQDAPGVVAACRGGGLPVALLRTFARLRRDPLPVTAAWLAGAQRDLRAVAKSPYRLKLAREVRPLRRIADVDAGWPANRQRRIDGLSARLRSSPPVPVGEELHSSILDLVAAVHGEEDAAAVRAVLARSLELACGASGQHEAGS